MVTDALARVDASNPPDDVRQLIIDWPLCAQFQLPPHPTIVVVGAYKGRVMDLLARMFPDYAKVVGFEPQIWAAMEVGDRIADRRDMWVHGVGLGTETRFAVGMGEWHTDAASFVHTGPGTREQGSGIIMEADAGLKMARLDDGPPIDLMVMNIEGGEYDLIPQLQKTGWLRRIDRLAVQWHLYGDVAIAERTMDREIAALHAYYDLEIDDRPSWTYFTKGAGL